MATDQGNPRLTSSVFVYVALSDINDFTPQFSMDDYTATVLSSAPVNTSLTTIEATDQDRIDNTITYSILVDSNSTVMPSFSINSEGVVSNDALFPAHQNEEAS